MQSLGHTLIREGTRLIPLLLLHQFWRLEENILCGKCLSPSNVLERFGQYSFTGNGLDHSVFPLPSFLLSFHFSSLSHSLSLSNLSSVSLFFSFAYSSTSGHKGTIWSLVIHGDKLISSSSDGTLKVWDAADLRKGCLKTVPGHNEAVRMTQGGIYWFN